jgi:hypothetical protein
MAKRLSRLNTAQQKLLRKHYGYCRELDSDVRSPGNSTEEHFVAVCRGGAQPITEHEVTYLAFKRDLLARGLSIDALEVIGFEPLPDLFVQPSAPNMDDGPSRTEQIAQAGWQARSTEAYERYGKEAPEPPPGFIFRDNRYGNRRWNS